MLFLLWHNHNESQKATNFNKNQDGNNGLVTKINILKLNKLCAAYCSTISERMDREENTTWISMKLPLKHTLILYGFYAPMCVSQIHLRHFIFLGKLLSLPLNQLYIWYNSRSIVFLIKRLHKVSYQNTWHQDVPVS